MTSSVACTRKMRFLQAVPFSVQQDLGWRFPFEELPAHHNTWSLTLPINLQSRIQETSVDIVLSFQYTLVTVAALVFFKFDVLYGEAYHKEWKGNDLCTKRYAYAHQNKLSLEGSAKEWSPPGHLTFPGWKKHRFSFTKDIEGNIPALYLAVKILKLFKLLHLNFFKWVY